MHKRCSYSRVTTFITENAPGTLRVYLLFSCQTFFQSKSPFLLESPMYSIFCLSPLPYPYECPADLYAPHQLKKSPRERKREKSKGRKSDTIYLPHLSRRSRTSQPPFLHKHPDKKRVIICGEIGIRRKKPQPPRGKGLPKMARIDGPPGGLRTRVETAEEAGRSRDIYIYIQTKEGGHVDQIAAAGRKNAERAGCMCAAK